jgi:P-type Ca2+ transporter type 2C
LLGQARTAGFTVLVFAQLFAFTHLWTNAWLWSSIALSVLLQVAVVNWSVLNAAFGTVPLSADQWAVCLAMASSVLWFGELRKAALRVQRRSPSRTPK